MTGADDGSDLPPEIIDIVQSAPDKRSAEDQAELKKYFADHSESMKRDRIALANLTERLDAITKKFPTMVMDIAPKPARNPYPQSRRLLPTQGKSHGRYTRRPPAATRRRARQSPRPGPVDDNARTSTHRAR